MIAVVASNDILGYYRMIEKIGAGGMGEVWKAEDTRLGRIVAIKILPPAIAADQDAIARMRREARTAAQINHPNIATIYSFEEIADRLFIVMEFVEGEPLTALIARGGIAEADVCRIGRDVAEALSEAHAKGIVHRDIKPDNVIVSGRRVKVLDFGIAKQVEGVAGSNDPTAYVTQQGMIIGTIQYMSPEQALGKPLDARTDIFSLGIVLYQMATGRLPFKGETVTETMTQIIRDDPPDPAAVNRALSPSLAAIIARCLRKTREQRFESAGELAAALDAQLVKATTAPMTTNAPHAAPTVLTAAHPVPKKQSLAWIGWLIAVIAIAAAAAFALMPRHPALPAPSTTKPVVTQTTATTAPAPVPATTSVEVAEEKPSVKHAPETTASVTTASATPAPVTPAPATNAPIATREPVKTASAVPDETPAPVVDESSTLFREALDDLVAGREPKARREFLGSVTANPQNKKAHLGLAITNRNWPRAKELAREIHEATPDDADLQTLRRLLHEMEQQQQQRGGRPRRLRPGVQ
jgi:serine/threonine protein kinase